MAAVRLIGSLVYIFGMAGSRLGGQGGGQEAARGGLGAAWGRPGGSRRRLGLQERLGSILGGPPGPFLGIFDGRVVKNEGPRNRPGMPPAPPEVSQLPQLRAAHPHAPGARMT